MTKFPITISTNVISNQNQKTINARGLHEFLGVGKVFAGWLKGRIAEYGFEENHDYVCFPNLESKKQGGHNRKEYELSFDMAKELCMVEKNERGREARRYFIECEKKLKEKPLSLPLPENDPEVLQKTIEHFTGYAMDLQDDIEKSLVLLTAAVGKVAKLVNTACVLYPEQVKQARMKVKG